MTRSVEQKIQARMRRIRPTRRYARRLFKWLLIMAVLLTYLFVFVIVLHRFY